MTDAAALSTFLTVESFMLAVLGMTANLAAPGRQRVSALRQPQRFAIGVAVFVVVLAIGAVLCWGGIYVGGSWRPLREIFIAALLLSAVIFQPAIAVAMAIGIRSQ